MWPLTQPSQHPGVKRVFCVYNNVDSMTHNDNTICLYLYKLCATLLGPCRGPWSSTLWVSVLARALPTWPIQIWWLRPWKVRGIWNQWSHSEPFSWSTDEKHYYDSIKGWHFCLVTVSSPLVSQSIHVGTEPTWSDKWSRKKAHIPNPCPGDGNLHLNIWNWSKICSVV